MNRPVLTTHAIRCPEDLPDRPVGDAACRCIAVADDSAAAATLCASLECPTAVLRIPDRGAPIGPPLSGLAEG